MPNAAQVTDIDKRRAVSTPVTLDGRPAVIAGYRNPFATVASLDGKLIGEWCWATAVKIADTHGGFVL